MEAALRLTGARTGPATGPPGIVSVHGLGFGDCGKGLVTDALLRALRARLVVRFNGGAQAAHAVVEAGGREHVFSQFGSGTLAGAATLLAAPVVVDPGALGREAEALAAIGAGGDAPALLGRVRVDARCRVTTPFHVASGRLRERARGDAAHGSCGIGFGETVAHALAHADEALVWLDLGDPALARSKLAAIRSRLAAEWRHADWRQFDVDPLAAERALLLDDRRAEAIADAWLAGAAAVAARTADGAPDAVAAALAADGPVVFEGAQGALLDEVHGFHPHTTWSATGVSAVRAVLADAGLAARERCHVGVLRTHLTRHGAGPLPTEDAALDRALAPERHNRPNPWQGRFRRGHLDAVLLRHALATAGPFDALAVTHLDAFARGAPLGWCEAHRAPDGRRVESLPAAPPGAGPLAHATRLGLEVAAAVPLYADRPPADADAFVRAVEALAGLPTVLRASGPTADHVRRSGPFAPCQNPAPWTSNTSMPSATASRT